MLIRNLEERDINNLCKIHAETLDDSHFSKHFSQKMLYDYYKLLLFNNEISIGVTDPGDSKILGYSICGRGYQEALRKFGNLYRRELALLIIKNPVFLFEKILDYYYDRIRNKPKENLYVIFIVAVDSAYKRKGIGHMLYSKIEEILLERGVDKLAAYIRKKNTQSINFHEQNKFVRISKNYKNNYYIKNLVQPNERELN